MAKNYQFEISKLQNYVANKKIKEISWLVHEFDGEMYFDDTALQIEFQDNSFVHFDGASDGEQIAIYYKSWQRPPYKRVDLEEHGLFYFLIISNRFPFKFMINHTITSIEPLFNHNNNEWNGLSFKINHFFLKIENKADTCCVTWEDNRFK